jgi:hypothetical protein
MCSQVALSIAANIVVNTLNPGGSLQWNCERKESTHNIQRHNNAPERKHCPLLSKTKCKTEAGTKPYSAEQRVVFREKQTANAPCPTTLFSVKKYSKTNPGKLFKWRFFKKERSLSLSLCNLRSYVS